jgi:FKBP-type peptidyl-prolyl cis-trans isomerase 2
MAIENGNVVKIHYEAKIGNRIIDSSLEKKPLEFKVGQGDVIKGLDEAVIGLKSGEKKTVTIPPEKAYGKRREGLTQKMPRNKFRAKGLEKGNIIRYKTDKGAVRYATIAEIKGDNIIFDLNHPLAGQKITFDLEILEVQNN